MSLHENSMGWPPVEESQTSETVTTDRKQTYRLHPSLPSVDKCSTAEDYVPRRSTGKNLHAAAVYHPDTQSEALAARSHVRMKAQILTLEGQRQELLSINEKWAKEYRTMNQYYTEKVKGLKASRRHDRSHWAGETREEGENNITLEGRGQDKESTKAGDAAVSAESLKAEREAKDLRAQNSTLMQRWQSQRQEIRRLNKALEEALQTAQPPDVSGETPQDVWKHQAEVYKEDFLKERRDREMLKEKSLELEKKLRKVHRELQVLKPQVTRA